MDQLIRFRCECGKKLKATRDIIGKKVRCTKCVRTHLVPESDRLTPKKTEPASKRPKNASKERAPLKPESKQQDLAATKPKKTTNVPPTANAGTQTATTSKSNSRKLKSNLTATKEASLIIADEMAANEPSLLPTSDDSNSRFKLDPKLDPEPSDNPLDPASNFEFDFDAPDIDTPNANSESTPSLQRPSYQRANRRSKLTLAIVAASTALLLLTAFAWLAFGELGCLQEFPNRPEVQNYVNKIEEFRKSQRTLKRVSEAYVTSKSPTAQERAQIEAFNRSIEPLANEEIKLAEALDLFQASEHEKARTALITATQTLEQKISELQTKAKDFSAKLR